MRCVASKHVHLLSLLLCIVCALKLGLVWGCDYTVHWSGGSVFMRTGPLAVSLRILLRLTQCLSVVVSSFSFPSMPCSALFTVNGHN